MNKLVGHWKLRGDCRDDSGNGNHGVNHGVTFDKGGDGGGVFNGCDAWIEMPMHSFEAGRMASDDRALGPGWNHLAAVREGGRRERWTIGAALSS
jgi:hypothetical protein